jgi:signal transduction histidine kinase
MQSNCLMGTFLQQVFSLLTTETGSLTYNLVLAFSIASALQISYSYWHRSDSPSARRLVAGLGVLLVLQLALWISAGLGWQGLFNADQVLPPLERAISLLSLLVIIWLWAFPQPSRYADLATALVGLLIITMSFVGVLWLSNTPEGQGFNGSNLDTIYNIAALVLIGSGALILIIRRPDGWSVGLSMLGVLAAGQIVALVYLQIGGDYSGALRLFQMIAYPLLLFLPQRIAVVEQPPQPLKQEKAPSPASESRVLSSALSIASENEPDKIEQAFIKTVAEGMQAGLGLLVSIAPDHGQLTIQTCYDQARHQSIPGLSLDNRLVPALVSTLTRGKPLRLAEGSSSPDLFSLSRVLELDHSGSLLAAPLPPDYGAAPSGLVLLNPRSKREWTDEDQVELLEVATTFPMLLSRLARPSIEKLTDELAQTQLKAQAAQDYADQLQQEKGQLQEQLAVLSESAGKDREQLVGLAAMLTAHVELQETLNRLQEENEALKQLSNPPKASHPSVASQISEKEQFEGELRLALEEVAFLKSALAEADQRVLELSEATSEEQLSKEQTATIVSIAQELRQPISSVMGYTDFLLGEKIGFLGTQQRKLLERVKVATERTAKLADDLQQAVSPEKSPGRLELEPLDLSQVIDEVVNNAKLELGEKNIQLQVDLPNPTPTLTADKRVVQQILTSLLHNAGVATPDSGQVALRVQTQSSEGEEDFVLVQVVDSGAGIPPQEIPRVFTQLYPPAQPGVSSTAENPGGLFATKTMVERLGGRVWVDSSLGQGSTFSVILPSACTRPPSNGKNGEQHE